MRPRTAGRCAWAIFAVSVSLFVPAIAINLSRPHYAALAATTGDVVVINAALLVFGWFGALVVTRRPAHPIGWLMCAFGLVGGWQAFATEYAVYGLISRPGALPGAAAMSWLVFWAYAVELGLLAALLTLFPTGRPPSRRWRWILWTACIAGGINVAAAVPLWPQRGVELLNLYGELEVTAVLEAFTTVGFIGAVLAVLVAIASLIARLRSARGAERRQIRLLLAAGAAVVVGIPALIPLLAAVDASEALTDLVGGLLIAMIPVATGVAILKYRLYDVDRLISRTVAYTLLSILLAAVYGAIILGFGQLVGDADNGTPNWVVAGATLAVAAVFNPARRRIQLVVDRRFNRRRYDGARIVESFSAQLRHELDLDALAAELVAVVDRTVAPAAASVWLRAPSRDRDQTTAVAAVADTGERGVRDGSARGKTSVSPALLAGHK